MTLREKANAAVVEALGATEDSFSLVAENPDRVSEIVDAVFGAVGFGALSTELNILRDIAYAKHPDDLSVDFFASAMKRKLALKRAEGYDDWYSDAQISQNQLSQRLRERVEKGDPVDVANYCMMLHQRGGRIK